MNPLQMSVVVPTFNRKDALRECLKSLERQTLGSDFFEVCIVDDGSTDGTPAGVEAFLGQSRLRIRLVRSPHAGPGAARNVGADHAQADILAFIEDDVIADEHWLEHALREFQSGKVDCLEGNTLMGSTSDQVRVFDEPGHYSFIPCNLFVKKKIFLGVGGYDTRFFNRDLNLYFREDADLGFRLLQAGVRLSKSQDVTVHHPVQFLSARDAMRHCRRYFFDPLLYLKHPRMYKKQLEAKKIGILRINRPFHYLCLFHLLFFLIILFSAFSGKLLGIIVVMAMLLGAHTGIRFRYERSYMPRLWKIADTATYLVLPFYYLYWLVRGCRKFHSWGSLL